jgi:hypothetical protein
METIVNTEGGSSTHDVQTQGGDFVGRDKVVNIFLQLSGQLSVIQGQDRGNVSVWQSVDWIKAEERYRTSLLRHYNKLRVFGKSYDDTLENVFIDVYLMKELTAHRYFDMQQLRESGEAIRIFGQHDGERHTGMSLVEEGRNLYVLGKPGAGKTTFLRWVTVQAAQGQVNRLPIFISLHEWATSKHIELLPFIVEQFAICQFPSATHFVEQLLQHGQAIVLFDGLDEVKQEQKQRLQLSQLLRDFTRQYDNCQFLITCRIAAGDYDFPGFQDVEVADFTPEQVEQYAQKWFGEQQIKLNAFLAELKQAENRGLRELCTSPLLLSMLCVDFDRTMHFPPNRAELYERAINVLLSEWDSRRSIQRDQIFYRELSPQRKKWLFAAIAKPTFERGEYLLREEELAQGLVACLAQLPGSPPPLDIDGIGILKAIEAQHSIFVERAKGLYSFAHLTFHEYFTVRYLVDNRDDGAISTLIHDYLTDSRWREIFLMTSSTLPSTKFFFQDMRQQIDNLITYDKIIAEMLVWVQRKTAKTSIHEGDQTSTRLAYIFLALIYARALEPARVVARSLTFTIDLIRDLVLAIDPTRNLALDPARDLASRYNSVLGLDYGLLYAWQYARIFAITKYFQALKEEIAGYSALFSGVVTLSTEIGEYKCTEALNKLIAPTKMNDQSSWQAFTDGLLMVMREHRDLVPNWRLEQTQIDQLTEYFQANELFVQCLKLAVVKDRQSILNSLLTLSATSGLA